MSASRRDFAVGAATAGLFFGLDKPISFIGTAEAQKAPAPVGAPSAAAIEKGFAKFKVGDIEVTQVYDGPAPAAAIDDTFVPGRSAADVKAALVKGGFSGENRPNFVTVTFVKVKGKTIMFDSSTGGRAWPTAGFMMARNMYRAGIEPQNINTIVVTHFHPDHISGMISRETNSKVFPDAEIVVPEAELKFWNDPALEGKVPDGQKPLVRRIQATLGKWKNVRQVQDGKEVLPGITALGTYGHTAGHTSYIVASGKRQLLVLGDVTNIPALNLTNPDWSIMFDSDKPMAAATRRKVFDRAIADKMTLAGYHWGMPGAGTIVKDGNGYALVPVKA
jgi:glyoxylase-like metal-dependent hydrolase (beta-lactamase superfamily II)